jgi:hypothetical protein
MNAGRNQGAEKSGKSCDVGGGVRRRSEDFPEPVSLKGHACVFNIVVLLRDILYYSICALLPSGFGHCVTSSGQAGVSRGARCTHSWCTI